LDIAIEPSYVCAISSRFELLREAQMTRWSRVHFIRQIQSRLRSKWARSTAVLVTLLLVILWPRWRKVHRSTPALPPSKAFFNGTIAKVASLVAIVIGGYGFAHGELVRKRHSPVLLPERALPSSP